MAQYQSGEIEPVYLTLADVFELHALIIEATAAEAVDHLRNRAGCMGGIRACGMAYAGSRRA
jgi:hypothetical protein